jgi:hypothetical protein
MDHIEQALSELKQEFTKILKMRGIPGPTGPAGSIDSAVVQARDVAERVATEAAKRAVVYPFAAEVTKLRTEFEALKAHLLEFTEQIENSIAIHTVKTLQDYGVLDANMNPLNKAHVESHLKSLGLLNSAK